MKLFKTESDRKRWSNKVIKKISQIQNIGCSDFCLLFDDIPFAYDVLDNPQNEDGKVIGQTVVGLTNEVFLQLKNQIDTLWLCPPDYCFKQETNFTKEMRLLNPEILVLWSGNDIFVETVTRQDLMRVKKLLGNDKQIVWWSNYPVNDCEQNLGMYNLGGFNSPKGKLNLQGILVNPMRECYANLPFYLTFQDYLQSPNSYKRILAYKKALRKLLGADYKSYEISIREFSAPNPVDSFGKFAYQKLLRTKTDKQLRNLYNELKTIYESIEVYKPSSFYASSFIKSIGEIKFQAKMFLVVLGKLLDGETINKGDFSKSDIFPTTKNIPRYFPEIFTIVKSRVTMMAKNQFIQEEKIVLDRLEKVHYKFINKYKGKQKLEISKTDSQILRKAITDAVGLDRSVCIRLLNSEANTLTKMKIFSKRLNINRFTVPATLDQI